MSESRLCDHGYVYGCPECPKEVRRLLKENLETGDPDARPARAPHQRLSAAESREALDSLLRRRGTPVLDHVRAHDSHLAYQVGMLLGDIARLFNVNDPSMSPVDLAPETGPADAALIAPRAPELTVEELAQVEHIRQQVQQVGPEQSPSLLGYARFLITLIDKLRAEESAPLVAPRLQPIRIVLDCESDAETITHGYHGVPDPDGNLYRRDDVDALVAGLRQERDILLADASWRHRWHDRLGRGPSETEGRFYERLEADVAGLRQDLQGLRTGIELARYSAEADENRLREAEGVLAGLRALIAQFVQGVGMLDWHDTQPALKLLRETEVEARRLLAQMEAELRVAVKLDSAVPRANFEAREGKVIVACCRCSRILQQAETRQMGTE